MDEVASPTKKPRRVVLKVVALLLPLMVSREMDTPNLKF